MPKQTDLEALAELEVLPSEIRKEILSRMDPASVLAMSEVSNTIRESANQLGDQYWQKKLIQHFPHVMKAIKMHEEELRQKYGAEASFKNETSKEKFVRIYEREYRGLVPEVKKIFSLIKENDMDRLSEVLKNFEHRALLNNRLMVVTDASQKNIIDWAVQAGGVNAIKVLIQNMPSEHAQYLLFNNAARKGYLDIVKYLVEEMKLNVDGDAAGKIDSPLGTAMRNDRHDRSGIARYLIENGAQYAHLADFVQEVNQIKEQIKAEKAAVEPKQANNQNRIFANTSKSSSDSSKPKEIVGERDPFDEDIDDFPKPK